MLFKIFHKPYVLGGKGFAVKVVKLSCIGCKIKIKAVTIKALPVKAVLFVQLFVAVFIVT